MHKYVLYVTAFVLLIGCRPASFTTSSNAPRATAISTLVETTATPSGKQDVADLLRNPPSSGKSIEIDAYFSGATTIPHPGEPPPPSDQVVCPTFYDDALTDRPFLADLTVLNSISSNPLPDDAPWLIAVTSEMLQPGVRQLPQLPYHARLRGHLGEPALAHCEHADRLFVIEEVVKVYEEKPSRPPTFQLNLPDDYATWSRYHDANLGFSLSYPADWHIDQLDDATWNVRAPQWPDFPMVVRVHVGETHFDQYDSTLMPPLLQGTAGFGVYEQGAISNGPIDSQHLTGYQVNRDEDLTERSVSVLFSGSGHTYELALRYPLGFGAPQPLLTAYSAIAESFRLDVRPGPSPTPPVKQVLGAGPFLSKDEALARVHDSDGREVTLLEAKLVSEAEARKSADACNTFESHPDGVWMLTVRGVFEDQTRTIRMYLDATSGEQLCGEEINLNATPWPTLPPHTTATPVPVPTNSTRLPALPDGRLLLLRGDAPPYELWTIRSDGTAAERLPISGLELKDDAIPSPDGNRLLRMRSNEQDRIARRSLDVYDLTTKRATILVDAPLTGAGVQEAHWSPDGNQVAFTSDAGNGQSVFDIWVMSSDGTNAHALTGFPITPTIQSHSDWFSVPRAEAAGMVLPGAHTLQWSPNGEWIAFAYVADQRATPAIKIIRAADGTLRSSAIPAGPYQDDEFAWTADGQGLLYRDPISHSQTWQVGLGETSSALVNELPIIGPWSPNRQWMVFNVWPWAKQVEADSEIWLYDHTTNQLHRLVRAADLDAADTMKSESHWHNPWLGAAAQSPWSPDGRWLAFIAQRDNQSSDTTWIAATDGSALRPVADGEMVSWLP